jgi:pilus assembly protein CpaC
LKAFLQTITLSIAVLTGYLGFWSIGIAQETKSKINISQLATSQSSRISIEKGSIHKIETVTAIRDVSVGDPNIVGANIIDPNSVNIFGVEFGTSKISLQGDGGIILKTIDIDVRRATEPAQDMINSLLPNTNIKVSSVGASLILRGNVPSARESLDAEKIARQFVDEDTQIINILEVRAIQQVLLKVRIAEMERSVLKTLGASLSGNDRNLGQLGRRLGAENGVAVDNFAAVTLINPSVSFFDDLTISALERDGLVKTLAEPALTAISGETANFLAGGELPIPSGRDAQGNVVIEFKTFGVALSFTPVVLSSNQISLRIKTEVSRVNEELTLNLQGVTVKGLSVRRADSTVNLPSGGQLMIAGLLSNSDSAQTEGLPFFKDLPILGALFRSAQFRGNKSELVIIVESYLVSPPSDNSQLSTPLANSAEINAFDIFFNRNLDKKTENKKDSDAKTIRNQIVGD